MFSNQTAEKLNKKKSAVLGVFTKAVTDLKALQKEQDAYAEDLEIQQAKLTEEKAQLNQSSIETAKAITKMEEFLSC